MIQDIFSMGRNSKKTNFYLEMEINTKYIQLDALFFIFFFVSLLLYLEKILCHPSMETLEDKDRL